MHDRLAALQRRILGGAYKQERDRLAISEEQAIAASDKERRALKRSKLPARPKLEPTYQMEKIRKPKGFKRKFLSLQERKALAMKNERGG